MSTVGCIEPDDVLVQCDGEAEALPLGLIVQVPEFDGRIAPDGPRRTTIRNPNRCERPVAVRYGGEVHRQPGG